MESGLLAPASAALPASVQASSMMMRRWLRSPAGGENAIRNSRAPHPGLRRGWFRRTAVKRVRDKAQRDDAEDEERKPYLKSCRHNPAVEHHADDRREDGHDVM